MARARRSKATSTRLMVASASISRQMTDAASKSMPEDLDCVVQPGITRKKLNEHFCAILAYSFPIDPGADASIGGMTATRASGTNAVRYGTMKDNVLSLTVVLADGRVIKTASRAQKILRGLRSHAVSSLAARARSASSRKSRCGSLVSRKPSRRRRASSRAIKSSLRHRHRHHSDWACQSRASNWCDELSVRSFNNYSPSSAFVEVPMLFVEFHGTQAGVTEQVARFRDLAETQWRRPLPLGGERPRIARSCGRRVMTLYWAQQTLKDAIQSRPPSRPTSVCRSRGSPIASTETQADAAEHRDRLRRSSVTSGDGNFHCGPILDMRDPDEVQRVKDFVERHGASRPRHGRDLHRRARHRAGQDEIHEAEEHSPDTLDVMARIKAALDPANIMNPGKILAA